MPAKKSRSTKEKVPQTLSPDTIARIAEFLSLTAMLTPDAPPQIYVQTNQLAFHLAMELPIGLFRSIIHGAAAKQVSGRYAAVDAVRDVQGISGQFTADDFFWAKPNIGKSS